VADHGESVPAWKYPLLFSFFTANEHLLELSPAFRSVPFAEMGVHLFELPSLQVLFYCSYFSLSSTGVFEMCKGERMI
jgi:hypothetical protein